MRIRLSPFQGRIRVEPIDVIDSIDSDDLGTFYNYMAGTPGCKFNKNAGVWHMPRSPYSVYRMMIGGYVFEHSGIDDVIDEYVELQKRAKTKSLSQDYINNLKSSFRTDTEPWDHQVEAWRFIVDKSSAYLAMDMGTGKTLVSIQDILWHEAKNILILCPKAVIPVWPNEFRRHAPNHPISACVLNKGSGKKKAEQAGEVQRFSQAAKMPFVLVVNYESAWREPLSKFILSTKWDYVIYDEAHKIKKPGGKSSRFCARLVHNSKKRLALSGTPLPNDKLDAYGQCRALDPGMFGTVVAVFRNRYAEMAPWNEYVVHRWRNEREYNDLLNLFMFRVDQEVLNLPPVVHQYLEVPLSAKARKLYESMERDFVSAIGPDQYISASNALSKMVRLAQITSGTVTTVDSDGLNSGTEIIDKGKRDALKTVLEGIDANEKIVVFCRFRHELETVERITNDIGRTYRELSGTRKELDGDRFPHDGDVLGVQLQSGGVGVNLSDSAYCVYFSLTFNLADYLQSLARTHRGGQRRSVKYIHILAEDTIDGVIYEALKNKKDVIDEVINYIKNGASVSSRELDELSFVLNC